MQLRPLLLTCLMLQLAGEIGHQCLKSANTVLDFPARRQATGLAARHGFRS